MDALIQPDINQMNKVVNKLVEQGLLKRNDGVVCWPRRWPGFSS